MQPEEAIYRRLRGDAALVALTGGRIYPDEAEEAAERPLIVYEIAATEELRALSGVVGKKRHTLIVYAMADRKADVVAVCDAVNDLLDRQEFTGVDRVYRIDYQSGETDTGGYAGVQTYNLWQ